MEVKLSHGKYVIAVSGGVDSMVLLDVLAKRSGIELIVAHFDHGIRTNSSADADFVRGAAKRYGLKFDLGKAKLGSSASEATARDARYQYLFSVGQKYEADAILTAHHQDDLIETAFINLLRGTGPSGLTALASNKAVLRPLLDYSKKEIIRYATDNDLPWREDVSNNNTNYLRNYVRKEVTPKLTDVEKQQIVDVIKELLTKSRQTDQLIEQISRRVMKGSVINRQAYTALPTQVGYSLLHKLLKNCEIIDVDRRLIVRLDMTIRTGQPGTSHVIRGKSKIKLSKTTAELTA
jgi:tRNA(Ile)-lysidine synthase